MFSILVLTCLTVQCSTNLFSMKVNQFSYFLNLFQFRNPRTEPIQLWRDCHPCDQYQRYHRSRTILRTYEWVKDILLKNLVMFRRISTETLEEYVRRTKRSLRKSHKFFVQSMFAVNSKQFDFFISCNCYFKNFLKSVRKQIKKIF